METTLTLPPTDAAAPATPPAPEENIFSPHQRHMLLIVSLVALAALIVFGLLSYLTAFLGAGILYVVLRPWFTALVHRRGWNRTLVTVLLLLLALVVLIVPFYMLTTLLIDRLVKLRPQHRPDSEHHPPARRADQVQTHRPAEHPPAAGAGRGQGDRLAALAGQRAHSVHRRGGPDALHALLHVYPGGRVFERAAPLPALPRKNAGGTQRLAQKQRERQRARPGAAGYRAGHYYGPDPVDIPGARPAILGLGDGVSSRSYRCWGRPLSGFRPRFTSLRRAIRAWASAFW